VLREKTIAAGGGAACGCHGRDAIQQEYGYIQTGEREYIRFRNCKKGERAIGC